MADVTKTQGNLGPTPPEPEKKRQETNPDRFSTFMKRVEAFDPSEKKEQRQQRKSQRSEEEEETETVHEQPPPPTQDFTSFLNTTPQESLFDVSADNHIPLTASESPPETGHYLFTPSGSTTEEAARTPVASPTPQTTPSPPPTREASQPLHAPRTQQPKKQETPQLPAQEKRYKLEKKQSFQVKKKGAPPGAMPLKSDATQRSTPPTPVPLPKEVKKTIVTHPEPKEPVKEKVTPAASREKQKASAAKSSKDEEKTPLFLSAGPEEDKIDKGKKPSSTSTPSPLMPPLSEATSLAPPPLPPTSLPGYASLSSPHLFELFQRLSGIMITMVETKGERMTTLKMTNPQSAFHGAEILIEEYSSSPGTFHVKMTGEPEIVTLFNNSISDLAAAFTQAKYSFSVVIHRAQLKPISHARVTRKGKSDSSGPKE